MGIGPNQISKDTKPGDQKSPICALNMLAGRWSMNVDYMDIDQVPNVPDTPDRLAAQDVHGRQVIEIGSDSSAGNTDFSGEAAKNQLRARSKLVLDNGHCKSLFFRPEKNVSNSVSNKSEVDGDFKGKALSTTQSPNRGRNGVSDLMEWRGPAQVFHNDVPNAVLEDCFQAKEFRKGSIPTNGFSSLRGISNSSATAVNTCRGKEKVNDTCKVLIVEKEPLVIHYLKLEMVFPHRFILVRRLELVDELDL